SVCPVPQREAPAHLLRLTARDDFAHLEREPADNRVSPIHDGHTLLLAWGEASETWAGEEPPCGRRLFRGKRSRVGANASTRDRGRGCPPAVSGPGRHRAGTGNLLYRPLTRVQRSVACGSEDGLRGRAPPAPLP